jgi:hypothetical protein
MDYFLAREEACLGAVWYVWRENDPVEEGEVADKERKERTERGKEGMKSSG